jgi:chemotaxis protein histidine kinase CheA/ActR/RegA family two-component response regulator
MELDRDLAEVFLEEAREHLAQLEGAASRPLKAAAARSLATAAGLVGLDEIKAAADEAAAALARGGDAAPAARRVAALLAALQPAAEGGLDASELAQLLVSFREEARDHLDGMTAALLALERDRGQRALIGQLLRKAHTIKGSAATVSLDAVSDAAHRLEEVLVALGAGATPLSDEACDALIGAVDTMRALLDVAHRKAEAAPLLARLATQLDAARPAGGRRDPSPTGPIVIRRAALEDETIDEPRAADAAHLVRVDTARLDQLMDGVGELVFDRTRIERRAGELRTVMRELGRARTALRGLVRPRGDRRIAEIEADLARHVAHLGRATAALLDDSEALRRTISVLQNGLTHVRMTRVRWLFQRLARPLRDLERGTGKRVTLQTTGGDTELDKAVVEKITDPMIALLRNALAHGIEPAAFRQARGKPAIGTISLTARHEGDAVFLEVADDGAGIDPARVRASLVAAGRLAPEAAAAATDEQIVAAIFEPGVSTRDAADELAGRGVGLDVVRENIARLGGDITVSSVPGVGTRFTVRLPLTTAISQAFLFKVGGQVYALPNVHIVETLSVESDGGEAPPSIELAGVTTPLVSLHRVLGLEPPVDVRRVPVIALEFAGRRLAATCDKIIGPREIVVKSLGPLLSPLGLYAGGTISGAGKVQLIFDPAALVEIAYPAETRALPATAELAAGEPRPRILVADDSRTVRDAVARMLGAEAYVVDLAVDGQDAWEMLHEVRYDLLVTDLEMPRLSGVALIERVRDENGAAPRLPVLAISSRGAPLRERAAAAGADDFLAKPVTRHELARRVARLLQRR